MEALVASLIGVLTAVGIYLMLRRRSFPLILGLTFLSYAVNLFLFASGRLTVNAAPIIGTADSYADPLPQALVLTAIVISFGMTAVLMIMAIGGHLEAGHDRLTLDHPDEDAPQDQPDDQKWDQP
ncbi:MAG: Na+/H+ antiporter subunit C [Rhodobacterales bacterium 32-66-7]|nr:MAG: Na+/H+ antiporter subunit C [Rhodobacterales bacterium 12-65-15]OYX25528.1 MAG: Na+/H+ antiporter subunit C [Rhodobacterales bacterium 32-66-7]